MACRRQGTGDRWSNSTFDLTACFVCYQSVTKSIQAPSCSFLCLAGTPAATSADTVVGALGWQPRHSLSIRRQRLSRRCPISSWKRISAAAASNSNSAASFDKDGASASADGSCGGAKGDGRAASAEAAKAAAAAAVADMFLQLDASLDEDQLMVVGTSAPSGEVLCFSQHTGVYRNCCRHECIIHLVHCYEWSTAIPVQSSTV